MKKTIKALTIGAIAIVLGGIITFIAFAISGFNLLAFSAENFTQVTTPIEGEVNKITVEGNSFDVIFLPSNSGEFKVVADETEEIKHTVKVENGELKIKTIDSRKWYQHVGFFFHDHKAITIYLPTTPEYQIAVNTQSADIKMRGITASTLKATANSGDIELQTVTLISDAVLTTESGDVNCNFVNAKNLTATTQSGDIDLEGVIATAKTTLTTKSGGVELQGCDSGEYYIETKSGDVEGNILTEKNFISKTRSGRVRVPRPNLTAGKCQITTKSGDIEIRIGMMIDD